MSDSIEGVEVDCPICKGRFPLQHLTVKSDAWLIREYDKESKTFIPVTVSSFDHTELTCPLCYEDFQDSGIEGLIDWGTATDVEVI